MFRAEHLPLWTTCTCPGAQGGCLLQSKEKLAYELGTALHLGEPTKLLKGSLCHRAPLDPLQCEVDCSARNKALPYVGGYLAHVLDLAKLFCAFSDTFSYPRAVSSLSRGMAVPRGTIWCIAEARPPYSRSALGGIFN